MAETVGQFCLSESDWNPETDLAFQKLKSGGRHSDHSMLLTVEQKVSPDDAVFAVVPLPPQPVAEHHYFMRVGLAFFGQERAAERELDAEHREEIGRHRVGVHSLWLAVACQVVAPLGQRRHILKGLALRLPVGVICRSGSVLRKPGERRVLPDSQTITSRSG